MGETQTYVRVLINISLLVVSAVVVALFVIIIAVVSLINVAWKWEK